MRDERSTRVSLITIFCLDYYCCYWYMSTKCPNHPYSHRSPLSLSLSHSLPLFIWKYYKLHSKDNDHHLFDAAASKCFHFIQRLSRIFRISSPIVSIQSNHYPEFSGSSMVLERTTVRINAISLKNFSSIHILSLQWASKSFKLPLFVIIKQKICQFFSYNNETKKNELLQRSIWIKVSNDICSYSEIPCRIVAKIL